MACVGAGVIGGGWVAYFLARGFRVHAWDPAPDAEARLRTIVEAAWPALTELGLADGATMDNLTVDAELATAVGEADYVQESAPEQLDVKRRLLADIAAADPGARGHRLIHLGLRDDRDGGRRRRPRSGWWSRTRSTRPT